MKQAIWLAVLVAALMIGHVYAQFGERLEEMIEAIEEQVEDANERDTFIAGVKAYIQKRDAVLNTLSALIAATGADEQEGRWRSSVGDIRNIPGLAGLALSSDEALKLYDRFMDEEQAWVSALSVLETAAYRDDIVQLRLRLANMTQLLEDKWQGFLNDDGQLDEKQYKVMADIYGILAVFARESDGQRQSIRNSLQIITGLLSKVDVIPDGVPGEVASAIKQALTVIAEVAKQYNSYQTTVETLRPQLQALAGQELGLLVNFNETRKGTQLFVEENGFDIMKSHYAEAAKELEGFDDVGTSGQRADAEAFRAMTLSHLSNQVSEGEKLYNDFVSKHNLKFFGPVAPDVSEYLVETKVWQAEADKVKQLDLERFLSALRSDANGFFGVSLSADGITDYEREFIEEQLRRDLEALQKAIDEAGTAFSTQNLSLIYDRRDIEDAIK